MNKSIKQNFHYHIMKYFEKDSRNINDVIFFIEKIEAAISYFYDELLTGKGDYNKIFSKEKIGINLTTELRCIIENIFTAVRVLENNIVPGIISGNELNLEMLGGIDPLSEKIEFHRSRIYDDINAIEKLGVSAIETNMSEKIKEFETADTLGEELVGDWFLGTDGMFYIDFLGDFAGTLDNDRNILSVEWSKHSIKTLGTSPCYRTQNGIPCGDISTKYFDVEGGICAYCLPEEFFRDDILSAEEFQQFAKKIENNLEVVNG